MSSRRRQPQPLTWQDKLEKSMEFYDNMDKPSITQAAKECGVNKATLKKYKKIYWSHTASNQFIDDMFWWLPIRAIQHHEDPESKTKRWIPVIYDADVLDGAEKHARSLDMDRNFWSADGKEFMADLHKRQRQKIARRSWNRQGYQASFEEHNI